MTQATSVKKRREPAMTGVDWSLIGVAAASAIGSTWFAVHMVMNQERKNFVFGAEHLGIFGRPSTAAAERARQQGVDMTPVGAISPEKARRPLEPIEPLAPQPAAVRSSFDDPVKPQESATPERPLRLDSFIVHDVIGDQALIMGPSGLTAVRVGSSLGVAGVVQKFELTQRGWVVVTTRGRLEPIP